MFAGPMRRRGLVIAACWLAAAGPAAAQHTRTMHTVNSDDGTRLEISASGEVEFTADDRDVARLSPDGRLWIEESRRGRPDRRVEYRPAAGGGVRRTYYEDGEARQPDGDDRAWIEAMLLQAIRDSGVGAEGRVARIRRARGTDGVLREIEHIRSDGAKRVYYRALLRTPGLRAEETVRAVGHAAGEIRSDGEKRALLMVVLERGSLTPAELGATLSAARTIASDGEKRALLMRAVERPSLSAAELAATLDAASTIRSDGELAALLVAAARRDALSDARVRRAFFGAAAGISSDGELARVLVSVLRREGLRDEAAVSALRTAEEISSDGERARVLTSVPARALRNRDVVAAYGRAMDGISSDGERGRVALYLARSAS
ncbi:MAG TPA: hypothetical protein VEW03_00655 [Longimicrobiaceae bacterium]|nr:hypothetical protein [Longimicrobiaceae bacterium]